MVKEIKKGTKLMMKKYVAKESFWIGEINKEIKVGQKVEYDDVTSQLILDSITYKVTAINAVIKTQWLVPEDGKYSSKMESVLGETPEQESDRKRTERFLELAKQQKTQDSLQRDEREVGKFVGGAITSDDPIAFAKALDLELPKSKYIKEIVEDDTKIIATKKDYEDKETKQIKQALNQNKKEKSTGVYPLHIDSFDAESKSISKYSTDNIELTKQNWPQFHWTKKADIIKKADKLVLKEIKDIEKSQKILDKIDERLQTLQN